MQLTDAQIALHNDPFNRDLQDEEQIFRHGYMEQLEASVKLLEQQSKIN